MNKLEYIARVMQLADALTQKGHRNVKVTIKDMEVLTISFENEVNGLEETLKTTLEDNKDALWGYITQDELIDKVRD